MSDSPLTEARVGVIAIRVLRYKYLKDGIELSRNLKRDVANMAKQIEISSEEAEQFTSAMLHDMIDDLFPPKTNDKQS